MSLHDELAVQQRPNTCTLCTFLESLVPPKRAEWERELALPPSVIGHSAVAKYLVKIGVSIEESSVRRHRSNHVSR